MGWCESPTFFCATSATARDVIQTLLIEVSLPYHPLQKCMLDIAKYFTIHRLMATTSLIKLLEVFFHDFIVMTNNSSQDHICYFLRAILIGVHSVFPPPEVSIHQWQDPISKKTLDQREGTLDTTKEILGWLVDGAKFNLQLMRETYNFLDYSKRQPKQINAHYNAPKRPLEISGIPLLVLLGERPIISHTQGHKNSKRFHSNHPKSQNIIVGLAQTCSEPQVYTIPCANTGERATKLNHIHSCIQYGDWWHHHIETGKHSILGLSIAMANVNSTSPTHGGQSNGNAGT